MENIEELESEEVNLDSKRKLATIQEIIDIKPIPNADSIEVATVMGWKIVVKKDEFKVGDKCIYVEIDSVLPEKDWSEFLRNSNFRIKTIRLRGQVSQGICFPLNILENYGNIFKEWNEINGTYNYIFSHKDNDYIQGCLYLEDDVNLTELLEIKKYIPKTFGDGGFMSGKSAGNFPSFIPKTDETRIQNLKSLIEQYEGIEIYTTEKIDGCSATYFLRDSEFGVCSRNRMVKDDDTNVYWKMARQYNIENILKGYGKNIAIQGEIIGPKIQGNKLALNEIELRIFDIFDIDKYEYYDYYSANTFISNNNLVRVPHIDDNLELTSDIDAFVEYATRKSRINPDVWVEGIVIRSKTNLDSEEYLMRKMNTNRISLKVINPEFLLKYDKRN